MISNRIKREYKKITGFTLAERQTNFLDENVWRKDMLFEHLSRLAFDSPKKLDKLKKKVAQWLAVERKSETLWALAGCVFYLTGDFRRSKEYFLKAVYLNPRNLDNWVDLGFVLRHLDEIELSNKIFFRLNHLAV